MHACVIECEKWIEIGLMVAYCTQCKNAPIATNRPKETENVNNFTVWFNIPSILINFSFFPVPFRIIDNRHVLNSRQKFTQMDWRRISNSRIESVKINVATDFFPVWYIRQHLNASHNHRNVLCLQITREIYNYTENYSIKSFGFQQFGDKQNLSLSVYFVCMRKMRFLRNRYIFHTNRSLTQSFTEAQCIPVDRLKIAQMQQNKSEKTEIDRHQN